MAALDAIQAIQRFKDNEQRVRDFANKYGYYVTDEGARIETIPSFIKRKEGEVNSGIGSMAQQRFITAVDYTPGVTVQLTLDIAPYSKAHTLVFFDSAYQHFTEWDFNGKVLTFAEPIPIGVKAIQILTATPVSIGTPSDDTVDDAKLRFGSKIYNRANDMRSIFDTPGVKGDGSDITQFVNNAITALPEGGELVFPSGYTYGVTSINVANKSRFSIRIDGKIKNLSAKAGNPAQDVNTAKRGIGATFNIVNCQNFDIYGSGSIANGFRESFCIGEILPANTPAPCSNFSISIDVIGDGTNDNIHANRIRYCSNFVIRDMQLNAVTKKPVYSTNAAGYYYNWAEALLLWDCTDFSIERVTSQNNAMNGIYVGSNCERFDISKCVLSHNGGSGIQLAWSSFGKFPRYFTLDGNRAVFNRADGWDINNTAPLADCFGTVKNNLSFYNGWGTEDTACTSPTNDGSGIGTFINIKKLTISNNIDVECSKTGGYFELVWDASVSDNLIIKTAAASNGDGLHFLRCTNIVGKANNVNVLPSKRALICYSDNNQQGTAQISENYFYGKVYYDGGANFGSFNRNTVITNETVNMPVHASGNNITVTGAGQNGLYMLYDNTTFDKNTISAPNFGIVAFGRWGARLIENTVTGGVGGVRVDSCGYSKISGNVGKGGGSPGIHLIASDNCELSMNQGYSETGNSLRIESTCTNTHKWANRPIKGAVDYAGTFGINF